MLMPITWKVMDLSVFYFYFICFRLLTVINTSSAAQSSSRRIADNWSRQVKHHLGHAVECATASGLQTFAEIQKKLVKVESVLNQPEKGNQTPFDFKGHIPESPEDGEKLALKWKQMWQICTEQRILGP